LTDAALGYRRLLHVDEAAQVAYVLGGADPTVQHVYRVPLGGAGPAVSLTQTPEEHTAVFSRQGALRVVSTDGAAGRRVDRVVDGDGREVGILRSVAEAPPFVPRPEVVQVEGFYAALVRPRSFEAGIRYPVIVYVYGGPGYRVVGSSAARYLLAQWIADHGIVVVSIDGRGTPYRGRTWERALRGSFVDVPLGDQAAALRALGARFDELDMERVGIFGWSFGGYLSAMAALRRPDVYRAAVAGAPVTDWRNYDTHYTERYLGLLPEAADAYDRSSVLTYVPEASRPLLIIHGTADDNVYFSNTLQLADALFRAGKSYDLLPLVGFTHMVPDPLVTRRLYGRIIDFFIEHL
jgi:dipeptidyl-peptidase-4